ncbi:MAG: glycine/betaine/sarcosine/D-proline family reductase selenoprotein B [Deltaproteobacteria bacterium]|nr:glycine/betaine/sarcosine/D-proline family reductase selenoprotein B [Deltaproteobacteria bacterium]
MLTIVHVVNQFFAGIGGEEKAYVPVGVQEGAVGAARGLQAQLGEKAKVIATVFYGDNYFHEHPEEAKNSILREVRSRRPTAVVAGPAFDSGRYGVASVEICHAVSESLQVPSITAMHAQNPGVSIYKDYRNLRIFLLPTADTAAGMSEALGLMARFALRLGTGAEIGPAEEEGYISRGIRIPRQADRSGVDRAIEMFFKKLRGEPFVSEIPMETWDAVLPADPVADLSKATVAVVTTTGLVPWGNPDGFKTYRNTFWRKYSIAGLQRLDAGQWEAIHGGYEVAFVNRNPQLGIPLDALRALENERVVGKLHESYYVVPGNQGAPSVMREIGKEIAADLRKEAVDGVLLVAT